MHDQCHRLNELILTFLANFVNGQSSVRKRGILWFFLRFCQKKKEKKETLTNGEVVNATSFRLWVVGHAFRPWRTEEEEEELGIIKNIREG